MSHRQKDKGKNSKSIPNRWLRCPRKSLQLLVNKFLIFKTPLSSRYDDQVPEECMFPVDFVFNSMKSYKLKLGLWIDLTFTSRFYDKSDVERHDCKYIKLQCAGFKQPPTIEQTQTFIKICDNFLRQNPLEIIGVHCTHGFNRSGFLLVSFLVEMYYWELEAAILKFAEVRPPGIYKKDYLVELYKRYDDNDVQSVPEPPPLPDWCYENEEEIEDTNETDDNDNDNDDDDDDFNKNESEFGSTSRKRPLSDSESQGKRKRKKMKSNFVKKNPTFMAGVPGVEPISEPYLSRIQKRVQDICGWRGSGFPGSQPVSMKTSNIHFLSESPYAVSWKADGVRYLMYIEGRGEVYFIDRDNCVFKVENITFPYRSNLRQHLKETLLDGEMVIDKVDGQSIPRYLVYDIVEINGYPIKNEHFFPKRYNAIKMEIDKPRRSAMQFGIINRAKEPFSIRYKEFFEVQYAAKFLGDKFCENLSHEPDGLIFQPAIEPYTPGQYDRLLKWKPPSLNSVDFRLKITTEKGVGILPKKIGELYVGDLNSKFAVLGSVKNLQDLNNRIIECKFENGVWVFMRERTDKSFPNSFETAKSVTESILNPVTQDMLLAYIDNHRWKPSMPPPLAPPPRSHNSRHYD